MAEYIYIKFKGNGKVTTEIHCSDKHLNNGSMELNRICAVRRSAARELTRRQKLRRFIRRLRGEWDNILDGAVGHIVGSEKAAEVPYITIRN